MHGYFRPSVNASTVTPQNPNSLFLAPNSTPHYALKAAGREPLSDHVVSMSLAQSRAHVGVLAPPVNIEANLANGLPPLTLVGLPETTVS
ncbi:hypothetical protein SAMN05216581_0678 [Pseudomonas asplenii]|uniref:Uncharacterized protein n=1 Tax=Pseudomonas asplenii TaxID=53407 RepID=A0A1H6LYJ8_9PSED|nr:hypothetical protein SAMN05216581_0678 [Pseudomonas fuscovaginae]